MDAGLRAGLCSIKRPRAVTPATPALIQRPLVAAYGRRGQDVGERWALVHRAVGGSLSVLLARRNLLDEVHDAPPQLGVADFRERLGQRQAVRGGEKVGDVGRGRCFSHTFRARPTWDIRRAIKKERYRHLQYYRDLLESARTDAIGAFFVLLNLLKCKAECVS